MKKYIVIFLSRNKFFNTVYANTPKNAMKEYINALYHDNNAYFSFYCRRVKRNECTHIVIDTTTKNYSYFTIKP